MAGEKSERKSFLHPFVRSLTPAGSAKYRFPEGSVALDGEYWLRGGLCWPMRAADGSFGGYGVLCGLNVADSRIYVFEEHAFVTVEPVAVGEFGGLDGYSSLANWLCECWACWYGRTFYWHQDRETVRGYIKQIMASEMIVPKPVLPYVEWGDPDAALGLVWTDDLAGRLIYRRDGGFMKGMREREMEPKVWSAAVLAVTCAVVGLEQRRGWKSLKEKEG